MKTVIVALNSKYIHTSLAPWYLKEACGNECGYIRVLEFSINDSMESVLASVYREKPDVAAFSCYIWNITAVLKLAEDLKKVSPGTKIVLGGPEVSFDSERLLVENPLIDYIIQHEGERAFKQLLEHLHEGRGRIEEIDGLVFTESGKVKANKSCTFIENLDSIPSPYTEEMLSSLGGRIAYFESSRGCPFSCSYCLSSAFSGVRFFSMDRVKQDIKKLMGAGVKQVKFVDRTFNCSRERAKEIFRFIIGIAKDTNRSINFHFEAAADLFNEEMLDILSGAPAGLIQFEIGIQTTNTASLEAINRRSDISKAFSNINKLRNLENIHLHLDLIAGLPLEDVASFKESFNRVYGLRPHQLQLGFLKMLKGSGIRKQADRHGYAYRNYPPYEVLYNKYVTFDEMQVLKGVEDLVERFYNSGKFAVTLGFIINRYFDSPFAFYFAFCHYMSEQDYLVRPISSRELYSILFAFIETTMVDKLHKNGHLAKEQGHGMAEETSRDRELEFCSELLKLDFLSTDNSNNLPDRLSRLNYPGFKERCFEFLKDETKVKRYLPDFIGMSAKQIFKQVHFELFQYDVTNVTPDSRIRTDKSVVLFNYREKNKVTGVYPYQRVEI